MKRLGQRKTRHHVGGHQDCAICQPDDSPNRAREKEVGKREIEDAALAQESSSGGAK